MRVKYCGATARWAWEQRRLDGATFFDLVDLYRSGGLGADASEIRCPVLVAVAERDHIVPAGSSLALAGLVERLQIVRVPSGHVSMIAGTGGRTVLWPELDAWLRANARTARRRSSVSYSGASRGAALRR